VPIAMEEKLRFAIREGGRTVGSGGRHPRSSSDGRRTNGQTERQTTRDGKGRAQSITGKLICRPSSGRSVHRMSNERSKNIRIRAQGVRSSHPRCVDTRESFATRQADWRARRCARGRSRLPTKIEKFTVNRSPPMSTRKKPRAIRNGGTHKRLLETSWTRRPRQWTRLMEARTPRRRVGCRRSSSDLEKRSKGQCHAFRSDRTESRDDPAIFTDAGEHVPVTGAAARQFARVDRAPHQGQERLMWPSNWAPGSRKAKDAQPRRAQPTLPWPRVEPKRKVVEFRVDEGAMIPVGAEITAEPLHRRGQFVDVVGHLDRQGLCRPAMKRWNFHGPAAPTHGVSVSHRLDRFPPAAGQDPGKTFKNKKMPGQMGVGPTRSQTTSLNLKVDARPTDVRARGPHPGRGRARCPGAKGGWITVRGRPVKKTLAQGSAAIHPWQSFASPARASQGAGCRSAGAGSVTMELQHHDGSTASARGLSVSPVRRHFRVGGRARDPHPSAASSWQLAKAPAPAPMRLKGRARYLGALRQRRCTSSIRGNRRRPPATGSQRANSVPRRRAARFGPVWCAATRSLLPQKGAPVPLAPSSTPCSSKANGAAASSILEAAHRHRSQDQGRSKNPLRSHSVSPIGGLIRWTAPRSTNGFRLANPQQSPTSTCLADPGHQRLRQSCRRNNAWC